MIDYNGGKYQVFFACQLYGSVIPKALVWAVPAAICAAIVKMTMNEMLVDFVIMTNNAAYASFSFVVAFLLTFRTGQAYSHFWEGTTLMQLLQGQWIGAYSSLLAFSSTSTEDAALVDNFRHKLIRLFSLLHAMALQYVATLGTGKEEFDIVGVMGLDDTTVRFIYKTPEDTKVFVTIQWIQQLIICNLNSGILPVPAPIVSRVFQDLSTGIVTLSNARKISDTPFPFPYAQTMTLLLLMHLVLTPFVVATWCDEWTWAACFAFVPVFSFWSINYIASEIEQPFGGDANDINIPDLQARFNQCMVAMLDPQVSQAPMLKESAIMDRDNLLGHVDTLANAYRVSVSLANDRLTRAEPAHEMTKRARWQYGGVAKIPNFSNDESQKSHDSTHQGGVRQGHLKHLFHGGSKIFGGEVHGSGGSSGEAPSASAAGMPAVAQDPRVIEPRLTTADGMLCATIPEEAVAEMQAPCGVDQLDRLSPLTGQTQPLTALALAQQAQAYQQQNASGSAESALQVERPPVLEIVDGWNQHSSDLESASALETASMSALETATANTSTTAAGRGFRLNVDNPRFSLHFKI